MDTYGVFRQEAHRWPMKSDSLTVPTRTSGVTATLRRIGHGDHGDDSRRRRGQPAAQKR
jgi:hypothetical protein